MSPAMDYAWVIEIAAGGGPAYWDGRSRESFSYLHGEAVRFARREDAERILQRVVPEAVVIDGVPKPIRELCRVVEHGWEAATAATDPMTTLRRLLWLTHGCPQIALYGDDGEMQCHACRADFKRDTAEDIERRLHERGLRLLAEAAGTGGAA